MKGYRADGTSYTRLTAECARRLLASSLILYLVGCVAQRAWVLLNADVVQLVRRLP